jgi:trimethylamine--corrinoid protein Co-methyltransferase
MVNPQTVKNMKTTALLPTLADRDMGETWRAKGGLDIHARAMRRARQILSHVNAVVFPPEVESRIRAAFVGLVAGDSTPLEDPKGLNKPLGS